MNPLRSWAARTARSLSHHLDRLRDTLLRLHGRLREAVADAVGGSVADAAQDAVREALLPPAAAPAEDARSLFVAWARACGCDPAEAFRRFLKLL